MFEHLFICEESGATNLAKSWLAILCQVGLLELRDDGELECGTDFFNFVVLDGFVSVKLDVINSLNALIRSECVITGLRLALPLVANWLVFLVGLDLSSFLDVVFHLGFITLLVFKLLCSKHFTIEHAIAFRCHRRVLRTCLRIATFFV